MSSPQSSPFIDVLKATLRQVENSTEWSQNDHAVIGLKRILLARIADVESPSPLANWS
jgi:hypothetical protein